MKDEKLNLRNLQLVGRKGNNNYFFSPLFFYSNLQKKCSAPAPGTIFESGKLEKCSEQELRSSW
jgi:hypothetical protein